jgi:hypothetical protein
MGANAASSVVISVAFHKGRESFLGLIRVGKGTDVVGTEGRDGEKSGYKEGS